MTSPEPEVRTFHLGDILTVTTDKFLAVNGVGGVYDLLGFMTGESIATHQWPRVSDECAPRLLEQHPQLAEVVVPEWPERVAPGTVWQWLADQTALYGETLPVVPLSPVDHTSIDPITELIAMREDRR